MVGDERVFAYEANPALLELVTAVHARNNVRPQVTQALLGEGAGERDFFVDADYWAS